ncbi:MAG: aldehyde oxidase [Elusimicrobia bacterium GWA2_56_46]|nr:MAG: aldehyde oxidase [Elusimicrobia bacterium GWA2_56_46]OGR55084.1 MAG: aldehyde oxidase [Elusimicrobia bacterium GWC2_56_31]HBB66299.1 aldehyde oxidase [Elusimicrobiota bacterium]HBW23806.1 aldehyde oxidase [Elusimicrobiota bacterium]
MDTKNLKVVNRRALKMDALGLACGEPVFTDDVDLNGMLYGRILWSPYAHARIKNIDTREAERVPGVKAVLTYKNVPRVPHTTAGQGYPEPSPYDTYILDNKMRFVGDRVAAVAAETPEAAEEALKLIKVEYEILPAVFDTFEAMRDGAPVIHDEEDSKNIPDAKHNIAARFEFEVKNGKWFGDADFVVERTYRMPYLQHCAIEPHTVITSFDHFGRLVIRTSTQVPFHVRRIVAQALKMPVKKIRVIKPRIGGGFGSKQEILLEDVTAALSLKTGKPVKIEYTRRETFISSRTRHPAAVRLKTGVRKDGTITDAEMDIVLNTGAYGSHALTVMMCSGSHTIPMYKVKNNIKFTGRSVYTNLPVSGAYRGYGATQGFFAWESQMDIMAEKIGMDPVEFRKMNYIRLGEGSPVFKAMGEGREGVEQVITSIGLYDGIEAGLKAAGWQAKKEKYKGQTGPVRRGLGMACMMQGSGIPEVDMASATIKMNEDGSFNLMVGAADLGTGSDTILAQIAAEVLGVKAGDLVVYSSDTDLTPFDVGAYASSTTFISGNAVKKTAEKVRDMILAVGAKILGRQKEDLRLENGRVVAKDGASCGLSEVANTSLYYYDQHQIIASASHYAHTSPPPFAANFAEVEVDMETGRIKILDYVSCVDCGTAINPELAEGQNDGAVLNGIGHTLSEEMEFSANGTPLNASFRRYKIFNTADMPPIRTILIPTYEPNGPFGAKSVSEIGINGPLPAVANAVYNAAGIRLFDAPFTPEKVRAAIKNSKGKK